MRQLTQKLIQLLLAICQLAAAAVVDAEASHDAVDYQEAIVVCGEVGGERVEKFELVLEALISRVYGWTKGKRRYLAV